MWWLFLIGCVSDPYAAVLRDHRADAVGLEAVVMDDDVVWNGAVGRVRPSGPVLEPGGQWPLRSTTKMWTGTLVADAIDRGRLAPDATIDTWFPEVPFASDIAVVELMQQVSGVANFTKDPDWDSARAYDADELVGFATTGQTYPPREAWRYSNTAVVLAAEIVDAVEPEGFMARVDDLGGHIALPGETVEVLPGFDRDGVERTDDRHPASSHAAASGVLTLVEAAAIVHAVTQERTVLSDGGLDWLSRPGFDDSTYGMGIRVSVEGTDVVWSHVGGNSGYSLAYRASGGATVFVAANTDPVGAIGIAEELADAWAESP